MPLIITMFLLKLSVSFYSNCIWRNSYLRWFIWLSVDIDSVKLYSYTWLYWHTDSVLFSSYVGHPQAKLRLWAILGAWKSPVWWPNLGHGEFTKLMHPVGPDGGESACFFSSAALIITLTATCHIVAFFSIHISPVSKISLTWSWRFFVPRTYSYGD